MLAPSPVTGDLDLSWLPDAPRRTSTIDWQPVDVTGLGDGGIFNGVIQFGGLLVMTGAFGDIDEENEPAAWTSTNGRDWIAAEVNVPAADAAMGPPVKGGPGLVAVGDPYVFLSTDGRHWDTVRDDDFADWGLDDLTAANGTLLCAASRFGPGPSNDYGLFRSVDGTQWDTVVGPEAQHVATGLMGLTGIEGKFVAFVADNEQRYDANTIEVWTSDDGASWAHASDMPDSRHTAGIAFVKGHDRFVAIMGHDNEAMSWSSLDGLIWTRTPNAAPIAPYDLLPVGSGFVGVGGHFPTEGTGIQYEDSVTGESWKSADGDHWQKVQQPGEGREIDRLMPLGDYIVGYGLDFNRSPIAAMWITPAPEF